MKPVEELTPEELAVFMDTRMKAMGVRELIGALLGLELAEGDMDETDRRHCVRLLATRLAVCVMSPEYVK